MDQTYPHKKNFCGGNFQNWLEVMLIKQCNGKCSFCIEKHGFKPNKSIFWRDLARVILKSGKKNILLLGGEPTLHPDIKKIIDYLDDKGLNVSLTTNGNHLIKRPNAFGVSELLRLKTINISIHHHDLTVNKEITGIDLVWYKLKSSIMHLQNNRCTVRFNCNIIKGYIDSEKEIISYIDFAKKLGANGVRFAELKNDGRFIDLADIFPGKYGLNKDPFKNGCWQNAEINGMKVNFRQLCGMQTDKRPRINNPVQILKKVLYYDGNLYDGWQQEKRGNMNKTEERFLKSKLNVMINKIKEGRIDQNKAVDDLTAFIDVLLAKSEIEHSSAGGCVY